MTKLVSNNKKQIFRTKQDFFPLAQNKSFFLHTQQGHFYFQKTEQRPPPHNTFLWCPNEYLKFQVSLVCERTQYFI